MSATFWRGGGAAPKHGRNGVTKRAVVRRGRGLGACRDGVSDGHRARLGCGKGEGSREECQHMQAVCAVQRDRL